jgi:hypothetical protein
MYKNNKNFQPVSKKIRLRLNNKPKTSTLFMYEKGFVNGKIALRFSKKGENFKVLVSKNRKNWDYKKTTSRSKGKPDKTRDEIRDIWNVISDFGGQTPDQAQAQRENCLTYIVSNYFKKCGYNIEEQPRILENTPDLLITKEEKKDDVVSRHSCYIELKAYFGNTIVGESEVAQILKYHALFQNPEVRKSTNPDLPLDTVKPKFMLITTGNLIPYNKNSFFNGEFSKLENESEKTKLIKQKYKHHLKKLGWPNNMESNDTRNIYRFAHKKIKKYSLALEMNYNNEILQLKKPELLHKLIENKNHWEVILIPAEIFADILRLAGLKKELELFKRLGKIWLERLVFGKSLLKFNLDNYKFTPNQRRNSPF